MMRAMTCVACVLAMTAAAMAGDGDDALAAARRVRAAAVASLDDALAAAKRAHAAGVEAANRKLLAVLDKAIEAARLRGDDKAARRLFEERLKVAAGTPMPIGSLRGDAVFECVLGVYGRSIRGRRYPFINLRPPTEANLWNDAVRAKLAGKVEFAGIEYVGTAKLVVGRSGWYTLHAKPGTEVRLNGLLLAVNGDVELRRGVYDVEIHAHTWGQPYINYAYAYFTAKGGDARLPFVNSGAAIKRFVEQRIAGRRVTEVTGYQPWPVNVDLRGPTGAVVHERPAQEATPGEGTQPQALPKDVLPRLRREKQAQERELRSED